MWKLIAVGPNIGRIEKTLAPHQTLLVGRGHESALLLPAEYVSRRHLQLTCTDEELRVADFGTKNGTLLNGHPIGMVSRRVSTGDTLQIGEYRIGVHHDPTARRSHPVPSDGFITLRTSPAASNPYTTRCVEAEGEPSTGLSPTFAPLLFEVASKLTAEPDEVTFLQDLLDYAQAATGFDGVVLLRDERDEFASLPSRDGEVNAPWSKTVVAAAVARTSALLVNHLPSDPRFLASRSVEVGQHLRVLCAPMHVGGQTLGALYLWTRGADLPTEDAIHFVGALAQLGGVALQRRLEPSPEPVTAAGLPAGLLVAVRNAQELLSSAAVGVRDDAALALIQQARGALDALRSLSERGASGARRRPAVDRRSG